MLRRGIAIGVPSHTDMPILMAQINDEHHQRELCDSIIEQSGDVMTIDTLSDFDIQRDALILTPSERDYMPMAQILQSKEYAQFKANNKV